MIGQKLTKILQSLKPDEFRRLKRAVVSPYFATNSRLLDLYNYLKKYYPGFSEEKLQKEKLYKKLYPDKVFNDGVLRVLIREFTVVVEDFILMERIRKDKHLRKKMLVKEYGERDLFDYFKKGTFEIINGYGKDFIKDMEYYGERIDLYKDYCFHYMNTRTQRSDGSLEKLMDSLDSYFVLAKYRFVQMLNNENKIYKKKSKYRFLDIVRNARDGFLMDNEMVTIYELINKLHNTSDEHYFFELKKIFFPNIGKIRVTDCKAIFYFGLNFCVRQTRAGYLNFFNESFNWYKMGLENGLLLFNGKMREVEFNNILAVAYYLKNIAWAEKFIEDYVKYLEDEIREDALNYNRAKLCTLKGDFLQAIHLLSNYHYGYTYQLRVRMELVKASFEQSLIDPQYFNFLHSAIEAFAKYLQRNTIRADAKTIPFKNHLNILEGLAKRVSAREQKETVAIWLEKKIQAKGNVALRHWLLEKVNDLK